jgi:hypothetical protein
MSAYWFIRTRTTYEPSVPAMSSNQTEFNRNVSYAFSGLVGGHGNAGDLTYRASSNAKAEHILCDGSALSRIGFPELFADIGESWGAGDGSTTFNIPTQAQLAGTIATPPITPPQVVTDTTVGPVVSGDPTAPVGGTTGGGVSSGGRPVQRRPDEVES